MLQNVDRTPTLLLIVLCLIIPFVVFAQEEDDDSKAIKAERFIKDRPADKSSRNAASYRKVSKGATVTGVRDKGMGVAQLGVTVWRFRPSNAADKTKELIEEEEGRHTEYTLERVEEGATLLPGQRVRISIESLSRNGYLYVIDREEY